MTGKFTEHLYNNIYHGIDAQVLWNPTFAHYPFSTGQQTPDGVATFHWDREKIGEAIRRQSPRIGWPEAALPALIDAYNDGLACWWTRVGPREEVLVSPDTAPFGQRAQRVELRKAGGGIAQWTYLPLHRVRTFEYAVYLRALDVAQVTVALHGNDSEQPLARAALAVSEEWREVRGKLVLSADAPPDVPYRFSITADAPGQLVIGHAFLYPADHVGGADPDVVRLLKEGRIPVHRWPGGNFASGYHWRDGVGPIERRPTAPNLAWGQPEPNTFGTDEFIALCRATGSEPMICVNAGNGTPEEAAQWVEYCNSAATTPLGKLRAANGHPEPYHVKHWEVGNELWGRWQVNWTTGEGYADRFKRFSAAMLAVDPRIRLYACGAPVQSGKRWNDALLGGASSVLHATTDHPLIGGNVSLNADPLDVFRDFMAVPDMLEKRWAALAKQMADAGIREPRLAITELQMFASLGRVTDGAAPPRMTAANLVNPGTLAEALYDVLFYHSAVRLAPFVEMVTHSATVNHGGGLRKEHERVYANPCYYAQAAFHRFLGATPVATELDAPESSRPASCRACEVWRWIRRSRRWMPWRQSRPTAICCCRSSIAPAAAAHDCRSKSRILPPRSRRKFGRFRARFLGTRTLWPSPPGSSLSKASWKCSAMPPRASCWNCPRIPSCACACRSSGPPMCRRRLNGRKSDMLYRHSLVRRGGVSAGALFCLRARRENFSIGLCLINGRVTRTTGEQEGGRSTPQTAGLEDYHWQSHCHGLFESPVAA